MALLLGALPALGERPILDYHRLDADFALYAHDTLLPWKPATVRLDTFTNAPVDFRVYRVDPADVLVAGENTRPRAIDTRRLHALASWTYTPPGGYRFQSNDVPVPLGSQEGFFVVEARRGDIGEQVWIDRTRIGLLSKETPGGIVLYAADLGSGMPLAHMRVAFIVRDRFVDRYTNRDGLIVWSSSPSPVFALAQWGNSQSFISFLPQAPLPKTILAIRTDSAVVRAGDALHVVGFARLRKGALLAPAQGAVLVTLRSPRGEIARTRARLDRAGAFSGTLPVPAGLPAGDYSIIAQSAGAIAGAGVHVDADAGGLELRLRVLCRSSCDAAQDVPVEIEARRDGRPVSTEVAVNVLRSPHVFEGTPPAQPWGLARWVDERVRTAQNGRATISIPAPQDGLASTYGVRVASGGATADTRFAVPNGSIALSVLADRSEIGSGDAAAFTVRAYRISSGRPAAGTQIRVQLVHGTSVQEQQVVLNADGFAHGSFSEPQVGSNLIIATADDTMDADQIDVEPQTIQAAAAGSDTIRIALDRAVYAPGESVNVSASLPDARGEALIDLESAGRPQLRVTPVSGGAARARFTVADAPGMLAAGAAFVRDGTLQWSTLPLELDAPGRPLPALLHLDKQAYEPGGIASVRIDEPSPSAGTIIVRVSSGEPSGAALFTDAPNLLAIGTTDTQGNAQGGLWHPWVDSSGAHALVQTFERRTAPPPDLTMTQAHTTSLYWNVERGAKNLVALPVPQNAGTYHLSVLKIDDDGRVLAAAGSLVVR